MNLPNTFSHILGKLAGETLENSQAPHTLLSKCKYLGMFTDEFNSFCRKSLAVQTCHYVLTSLTGQKNNNDSIIGVWEALLPGFPADWRQLMYLYLSKLKKIM